MAERLGSALLELGTDDRKLKSGLDKAESRTRQRVNRMAKVFAGILTTAAVAGLVRSFDRVITKVDQLGKTASKLGLTAEALQELRFAADLSGLSVQQFDMGFQRFVRRAAEAAKGTGEAKAALKELGIQLTDTNGVLREGDELLGDVANAFSEVESKQERLRLAFKLFDSEGVAFVNLIGRGADEMNRMRQEARDLGLVLSNDMVRDAERMKDELTRILTALSSIWAKFVINFGQGLDVIFNILPETIEERLVARIDELRKVQDSLARFAAGGSGRLTGRQKELQVARLNEQQDALITQIQTLENLRQAKEGALGSGGTTGSTTSTTDPFGNILENIEAQANAMEVRAAAVGMNTTEMAEFVAITTAMNRANREGLELTEAQIEQLAIFASDVGEAAGRFEALSEAQRESADAARESERQMERMNDTLLDAIVNVRDLDGALNSMLRILKTVLTQKGGSKAFTGALGGIFGKIIGGLGGLGGGGGGGAAAFAGSSVTGTSSVPSFAHGGHFKVGGRAGIDSNLVQFNATRGEQIDITPEGKQAGGNTFIIDARGTNEAAIANLENVLRETVGPGKFERRAISAVVDARRRDPNLFGRGAA